MRLISYEPYFESVRAALRERDAANASSLVFKRKLSALTDTTVRARVEGDARLRDMERVLGSFVIDGKTIRSNPQKDFHKAFVNACLPHIYSATEFEQHKERILKERGLDEMQPEVLVCCPRRCGKTTAVAMFIAAMLYVCPEAWISCFSTGQRASTSLLDQAYKLYCQLPGAEKRVKKRNQEQFFVTGPKSSEVRRFYSYPSSVAGLKGVGCRVAVLEEASRMDEAVFNEVVLPLLGVNNTSVIAISTPMEDSNYFSQLLRMVKPNGSHMFKTIHIKEMCDDCLAAKADSCPHMQHNLPPWKSRARSEMVKTLMAGNREMWLREQMGVPTSRDTSAFDRASVEVAFASSFAVSRMSCQKNHVYVSIDPSGGGFSQTAIVAGGIDITSGKLVIVGADGRAVTSDKELCGYIRSFLGTLRAAQGFANVVLVIIIERNYGGLPLATRIAEVTREFQPVKVLSGDTHPSMRTGVVTTDVVKERARVDLQKILDLESLCFAQPLVSSDAFVTDDFKAQLHNFKYVYTERPNGSTKAALSGKGYGSNDDLVMALLLLVFWSAYASTTPTALL